MSGVEESNAHIIVTLSLVQRRLIAEIVHSLIGRLKLDEPNQRRLAFTRAEMMMIRRNAVQIMRRVESPRTWRRLRDVSQMAKNAVEHFDGLGAIRPLARIYQFKITLLGVQPAVWRRIQIRDCTLDKLHERIQTAMGWTNSHLHDFTIERKPHGDPMLLEEMIEEFGYADSTTTKVSQILPRSGKRLRFEYRYDFGDCWRHEILFEGCLRATPNERYPLCVEGERACPPEDIGGASGYRSFVESIADRATRNNDDCIRWFGDRFKPEAFDAMLTTKRMRRGLPNWRRMR
jgi:hypothetical protein